MIKIVTVAQMKAIEAAADRAGLSYAMMMDSAGQAVAEHIMARVTNPAEQKAVVLCGTGNNGGDGLVAANRLAESGISVAVYSLKPLDESDLKVQRLREKGLLVVDAENDQRWRGLKNLMRRGSMLGDGVLRTCAPVPIIRKPGCLR